jgi:hypothetical protein
MEVREARVEVEVDRDARAQQSPDVDPGRRQAAEVGAAARGGRGVDRVGPQRSPSSAWKPSRPAQPSKTPMSSISWPEGVSQRSSSIG